MTDFVRGINHLNRVSFTRPADGNAYTSGDVINNSTTVPVVLEFPRATIDAGGGSILQEVLIASSQNAAAKPDLELWLFDTTVTPDNDNAVFTPTDAELLTLVGIVVIPATAWKGGDAAAAAAGNSVGVLSNIGMPLNTRKSTTALVGTNSLFGVLVARSAYAAVTGEVFQITLKILD